MNIPDGANTALAMKFLGTESGKEWSKTKDYDSIYGVLGKFTVTLECYEIPQPEPIVKGIKFIIEEYNI
jgi:hypothetical protein